MSDEKKKTALEIASEKGLTKFKTDEDLVNSYLELEKKYSNFKPSKDTSDKDLIRQTTEFYKDSHNAETILEGSLGQMEQKLVKEKGLHPKIAAAAVAEVAGKIASDIKGKNKQAVTKILGNSKKKEAIEKALSEAGLLEQFQESYNSGLVSSQEAELWAKIGGSKESSKTVEENNEGIKPGSNFSGQSQNELQQKWDNIVLNLRHPYHIPKHPEHNTARKEIAQIETLLEK